MYQKILKTTKKTYLSNNQIKFSTSKKNIKK